MGTKLATNLRKGVLDNSARNHSSLETARVWKLESFYLRPRFLIWNTMEFVRICDKKMLRKHYAHHRVTLGSCTWTNLLLPPRFYSTMYKRMSATGKTAYFLGPLCLVVQVSISQSSLTKSSCNFARPNSSIFQCPPPNRRPEYHLLSSTFLI